MSIGSNMQANKTFFWPFKHFLNKAERFFPIISNSETFQSKREREEGGF